MSHFHSNMSERDFLEWLRSAAIKGNMPPQFIDRVDDLFGALGAEAEFEAMELRATEAEDLLHELVTACRNGQRRGDIVTAAEALLREVAK